MSSGYQECVCCGGVFVSKGNGDRWCHECIAAGCDPSGMSPCEIPQCPRCDVRASLMTDGRWHANCDGPCPNKGLVFS